MGLNELLAKAGCDEQDIATIPMVVSAAAVSLFALQTRGMFRANAHPLTIGELESGMLFALEAGLRKMIELTHPEG